MGNVCHTDTQIDAADFGLKFLRRQHIAVLVEQNSEQDWHTEQNEKYGNRDDKVYYFHVSAETG